MAIVKIGHCTYGIICIYGIIGGRIVGCSGAMSSSRPSTSEYFLDKSKSLYIHEHLIHYLRYCLHCLSFIQSVMLHIFLFSLLISPLIQSIFPFALDAALTAILYDAPAP